MRNANRFTVSLVLFCCFLVVLGIFALWPNDGLVEKAFGQRSPRVIFLGDVDERPDLKHKLPPGYEGEPRGLDAITFNVNTFDRDDPNAMYEIGDYTNTGQQIKAARDLDKETIYFTYEPEDDPDEVVESFPLSGEQIASYLLPAARLVTFDFLALYPENVTAHAAGNPPTWSCTSNCAVPGAYIYLLYPDDFADGLTARTQFVNMDMTVDTNWMGHVMVNQHANIANWDFGSQESQVDCFNSHNTSVSMYNPSQHREELWRTSDSIAAGTICPPGKCGCATGGSGILSNPRKSQNKESRVALKVSTSPTSLNCDLDVWTPTRHELMHTYGYTDSQITSNMNNTDHCSKNHIATF